jgi:hypothetical protein
VAALVLVATLVLAAAAKKARLGPEFRH